LNALSATVAGEIGDIVHGTRHRAPVETRVCAPYSTWQKLCSYLRRRIAGWLFRYFVLQSAFPFPLWLYADRRACRGQKTSQPIDALTPSSIADPDDAVDRNIQAVGCE